MIFLCNYKYKSEKDWGIPYDINKNRVYFVSYSGESYLWVARPGASEYEIVPIGKEVEFKGYDSVGKTYVSVSLSDFPQFDYNTKYDLVYTIFHLSNMIEVIDENRLWIVKNLKHLYGSDVSLGCSAWNQVFYKGLGDLGKTYSFRSDEDYAHYLKILTLSNKH